MTADDDVVLLGGVRTPFSTYGGALRDIPSVDLAAFVIKEATARTGVPAERVDEVNLGVTIPAEYAMDGSIPARVALLRAGLPDTTRCLTLDRACCSSATAIHLGFSAIRLGRADFVVAAGTENMGRASFLLSGGIRWGHKRGSLQMKDPMDAMGADIGGNPVAVDAGEVAVEYGLDREAQDQWACRSQMSYQKAKADGFFEDEIVPYTYTDPKGREQVLREDEGPRPDTSLEKLGRLPTVYGSPTVTPGNAPGVNTGACAVVLTRRSLADSLGLQASATIRAIHSIARNPREIAVAPGPATLGVLDEAGWGLDDIDVFEVNEAFAAVPLVSARVMADGDEGIERSILDRMNVNGGAVAVGHPTGASGARLALTAARQLRRGGGGAATTAICGGLGMADAIALSVP